jgi:transcriptional regulator with XRE-family HTH domain
MSAIFGRNVRHARLAARISQGDLAQQAGLKQQYVSLIESGRQNVTIDTAVRLAAALRLELWTMLTANDATTEWDGESGQSGN